MTSTVSPTPEVDDDLLLFADEEEPQAAQAEASADGPPPWQVLIVDDEPEVHAVTRLALSDFVFEGRPLAFLSAYSAQEAQALILSTPDICLVLLDVVMETDDSGLRFAHYLRQELRNHFVRIVLRTGQPGQAPESSVILDYDINDYKAKTELTTQRLFTTVVSALRSFRDLTQIERHRRELEQIVIASSRFVPTELLRLLNKRSIVDVQLGDQVQAEMTVMFTDVRSFTTLSEQMTPKETFDFINGLLHALGPLIRQHEGFIDKYIGDSIMALFPNGSDSAIRAALAIQERVARYNDSEVRRGHPPIRIGVGLHTGHLMLGMIGEEMRLDGTVISDAVNLAARLEKLSKTFGASILVSKETLARLEPPAQYDTRFLGEVQVEGKTQPVAIYEVFDGLSEATALKLRTRTEFESGVRYYTQRALEEAEGCFSRVLAEHADDRAAQFYQGQAQRQRALRDG